MTELSDEEVFGKPREMTDADVFGAPPPPPASDAIPEAFLDRVRAGQALSRILSAAGHEAKEGMAGQTPTGYSDERLQHMIDIGVFHDPLKSKPGPIQMANEAVLFPVAQAWQGVTTAINAGIHGAGGAVGQLVEEFGGSQGTSNRAKNEIINVGNWAMIEGGMGRFSRPAATPQGVMDQPVGGLPRPEDFTNAAKVLDPTSPPAGPKLRLAEAPEGGVYEPEQLKPNEKYFKAFRPDGEVAAEIMVKFDGKKATIEDILAPGKPREQGQNTLGPSELRSVLRQFQETYPEIETLTGKRVSGARMDGGYSLLAEPSQVEVNLRRMWQEDGIHPAEAVHDAANDAFLKNEITARQVEVKLDPADVEVLTETGGEPGSLGAAATDPADVSLDVQPASPPSSLIARVQQASGKLFDVGHDIQMKLTPMARGTMDSMATVKDYMNNMRRNSWDASRIDTDTLKRFSAEDRARMASAMEEESLSLRLGETASAREHQGLATLDPEQRAFIVEQDTRQQLAWLRARDLGMVEGEGVPMHFPRMVTGIPKGLDKSGDGMVSLTAIGYDLRSGTPYLKQRKHLELEDTEKAVKGKIEMQLALQGKGVDEVNSALEKVKVVRDIRAVNLATKQLEDAVAGRQLIENIKEVGKRTGNEVVSEGFKPDDTWFTVDHPAFKTWRPKFEEVDGKIQTVNGADGKPVFEQVPIYVRDDFEGPLRSAMWGKSGAGYQALMAIKGKTMSYIMNSPMIHNMVEWGRALAAAPFEVGTLRIYFTGNRAKHDVATMHEAIGHGLVPIGKRFFNQDINALMEEPNLTPGRSIEAQAAAFIPGLFDEAAGTAVKQAIDKAGDFWHNTMLWDRIADLQAGLYVHLRDAKIASGLDRDTASYMAARWANQYAGALPKEAMSEAATKVSNFMLFSRSFTFGNLSVIKDLFTGMPRDVLAQIERDARFKAGSIEAAEEAGTAAVSDARSMGRRKALMTMSLEMALLYAGNSVLQSAFNVMLGGKTLDQEGHDYIRRFRDMLNEKQAHPLSMLQPFHTAESLSSTNENEPNRKDRIFVGNAADGTAIYMRAPWGKIGEEFTNWFSSPIDMAKKKEGTIMRPMMQILSNDAGFKREIYDPRAETWPDYMRSAAAIAKHLVLSQLPIGQFTAGMDLVRGDGDKLVSTLQLAGPFAGFTFSKGAPGGRAVGEMYDAKGRHEFAVNQALPDIRRQIKRGDTEGAIGRMTELNIPQGLQRWYIKTTLDPALRLSPRATRDFYLHSTPEQRARFDRAQQAPPSP